MNKELQKFCRDQFLQFREHLFNQWGFQGQAFSGIESDLKSLHKQHLGLSTLCFALTDQNDRGVYLAAVPEATELAMILTAKGLCNSAYVLMRQCIELTLKHIYFSTHPVEFQWSQTREGYREIGFQFLLDYLRKTDELSHVTSEFDLIADIEGDFHRFSRYVHAHSPQFMAFVPLDQTPEKIAAQTASFAKQTRHLVSRLCFLLGLYFHQEINRAQANEVALIKNAVQGTLSHRFKQILAQVK